jgi:hypothetical protein
MGVTTTSDERSWKMRPEFAIALCGGRQTGRATRSAFSGLCIASGISLSRPRASAALTWCCIIRRSAAFGDAPQRTIRVDPAAHGCKLAVVLAIIPVSGNGVSEAAIAISSITTRCGAIDLTCNKVIVARLSNRRSNHERKRPTIELGSFQVLFRIPSGRI